MTPRQRQFLEFIARYRNERGYSPSYVEIGAAIGMAKSGVAKMVDNLVAAGLLSRVRHGARSLEPVLPGLRVRLEDDVLAQVKAYAKQHGISPETAVAEATRSYFGCVE